MRRYWMYFKYVIRHKWFVFQAGRARGWPLLALIHDNSKFLPDECVPYARHFYQPNGSFRTKLASDGFYEDEPDDRAFDRAWLKHIQRNKHHPQHWVRIHSFKCACAEIPRSVQMQYGWVLRDDVLLEDDGSAICLSCYEKHPVTPRVTILYTIDEMPLRYREEMLADWIGAGMAQGTPDTKAWYLARGKNHLFGSETRAWIEAQLDISTGVV